MKRILYLIAFLLPFISHAQSGNVYTHAGGGSSTADGIPATSAKLIRTTGLGEDGHGNIYFADEAKYIIRRVDAVSGLIQTIAGNGTMGYSGDAGPATNAKIASVSGICSDIYGNVFIADSNRIRFVNNATGIITTVAGGGSSTANGVPATAAKIGTQRCVAVDLSGNIYCSGINCIRKVNTSTGLISTIAGGGSSTANWIPATAASLTGGARNMVVDGAGNVYFIDSANVYLRKIEAGTGLIHTVSSSSGFGGFGVDPAGNIFSGDWASGQVRRTDVFNGSMVVVAGGGSSYADSTPATSANIKSRQILVSPVSGNVYYTTDSGRVRKFSYNPILGGLAWGSDSFSIYFNEMCSGPQIYMYTNHYAAGTTIKLYFGDGTDTTVALFAGYGFTLGFANLPHIYPASGSYTIKSVMYHGSTVVDSITSTYNYVFCSSIPVHFYRELNGNCVVDSGETPMSRSFLTEVDSNGVVVDTISAMSGFYYTAYGNAGDYYQFRVIAPPGGYSFSCPSSGIITDTLRSGLFNSGVFNMGFACSSTSFDIEGNSLTSARASSQTGIIVVQNNYCTPVNGTATLTFSPKYSHVTSTTDTPTILGNTMVWNFTGVYYNNPVYFYYMVEHGGSLPAGDTVQTKIRLSPLAGDADTSNNEEVRVDTIRASADPNFIEVTPGGHISAGSKLTYTTHFENTGNDTALNIFVLDTLSDFLDPSSLRLLQSSAPVIYTSKYINAAGHTVMKFDFPGINLLDSSHHGECDGMFKYSINTKPGLPNCTHIYNRAGIYFDYNAVVMTNEVDNVIACWPASVSGLSATGSAPLVYPNPANDELTIQIQEGTYTAFTITNSIGVTAVTRNIDQVKTHVDIKQLPAGIYYIMLRGENGTTVKNFVKL